MSSPGLLITVVLTLAAGALFFANGVTIFSRRRPATMPLGGFAVAWMAVGVVIWTQAIQTAIGFTATPPIPVYNVMSWLKIIAVGAAVAGLSTYILYVWTGWQRVAYIGGAIGLLQAALWLALAARFTVTGIRVGRWGTKADFTPDVAVAGGSFVVVGLFLLPFLCLVVAYLIFWPRAQGGAQRYRVMMVSASIALFFAAAWVQAQPTINPDSLVVVLNIGLMVLGGAMARIAFVPPERLRERYGLEMYPA